MTFKKLLKESLINFIDYKTPKVVNTKSRKIGFFNRFIQTLIIFYIIGFVIIYKKGYQEFATIESSITTKVKGIISTKHLNKNDFNDNYKEDMDLYIRVWDISDLVVPASENEAFFVTTNIIISPNQRLGFCAEDVDISDAICDPEERNECANKVFLLGHGVSTGNCINSSRKGVHTCEIEGWCPIEKDGYPLKNNTPLFTITKNFTVLIKTSIQFNEYNVRRRNIIDIKNSSNLRNCTYDPELNPGCPIFVLGDIVKWADEDYDEISRFGGVIGIEIIWDCNLDIDLKYCVPNYSFRRLDDPKTRIAKGWNFRYSHYFKNNSRTLFKATGIRFVLLVNGSAGRFNFIPLAIKIGSGLGLLAITSIFCDLFVLYFYKSGKYYKEKISLYIKPIRKQQKRRQTFDEQQNQ